MTTTARSVAEMERRGWIPTEVERRIARNVTRDAFGFADILALDGLPGSLLVQTTSDSGGNVTARIGKILGEPRAVRWLEAGNRIAVWGWGSRGGKRDPHLRLREVYIECVAGVIAEGSTFLHRVEVED